MSSGRPIYCGKCGTANPADNQFCRRCGHDLREDIVPAEPFEEPAEAAGPTVLEGIEVQRYPLVDPETGEEIPVEPEGASRREAAGAPPERRGGTILWSLGLHLASVAVFTVLAATVVVAVEREWVERLSEVGMFQIWSEEWALVQRPDFRDMTDEQRTAELARIMRARDPETLIRAQLILQGSVLLSFFVAGAVAGRLRRPRRLMDVGLGGLLVGAAISLCCNPILATLGFLLCLGGAWLGRRWGSSG